MRFRAASLAVALLAACSTAPPAPGALPGSRDRFERISPEAAGYSSAKLAELPALLASAGSESLLLLHDGRVFFEWGDIRKKRLVHSMRKALLNGLLGTCWAEGRVDLQATLAELGIDDIPASPSIAASGPIGSPMKLSGKRGRICATRGTIAERPGTRCAIGPHGS